MNVTQPPAPEPFRKKEAAPAIDNRIAQALPCYSVQVQRRERIRCPRCGSDQTGFYEVAVRRCQAVFDDDGSLSGDWIDSVLDYDDLVEDQLGRTVLDCFDCGLEFAIEPLPTPDFLGEGI